MFAWLTDIRGSETQGTKEFIVSEAQFHSYNTPIAFDERVTFWFQRAGSLTCACVFAALYACAIA